MSNIKELLRSKKFNSIASVLLALIIIFLYQYCSYSNNATIQIKNENDIIGVWKDDTSGLLIGFESNGIAIVSKRGQIALINNYFITNSAVIQIDAKNNVYSNYSRISKNKKRLNFRADKDIIYKKVDEKEYHIVKNADEVIGLWGKEIGNTHMGYSFFDDGSLVILVGSKPMKPVLKYYITNDIFFTIKDGEPQTQGFPLVFNKYKNILYIFGDIESPLTKYE